MEPNGSLDDFTENQLYRLRRLISASESFAFTPLSEEALKNAEAFLSPCLDNTSLDFSIYPIPEGGVQFEFRGINSRTNIEVDVLNAYGFDIYSYDTLSGEYTEPTTVENPQEAIDLVLEIILK